MNITLREDQKKAVDFFNKNKYLILEGDRQSGKTTVLQEICVEHHRKRIGICCPSWEAYRPYRSFGTYIPAYVSDSLEKLRGRHFDLLIFDEINPFNTSVFPDMLLSEYEYAVAYTTYRGEKLQLTGGLHGIRSFAP